MKKQHNNFTNHEAAIIAKHWPTLMPMRELLTLLPRHTENSVTQFANDSLDLRRPRKPKHSPAWDRVKKMISEQPMTQLEIAKAMGFSSKRACELIKLRRSEVRIESWKWCEVWRGRYQPVWTIGTEPDAIQPIGRQRAAWIMRQQANPFLIASGAIIVPKAPAGRVFRIADDDREAA